MDASSAESLERGYLQVAKVCGLEADRAVAQRWLSNISEPWALILDNADDPRLNLSSFFPVGNRGVILITTRNPDCKIHATAGSFELGGMATDEAVTLMLKTAGTGDLFDESMREAATPVVLTLGRLALAITQAGAVIRQGRCGIEDYCTLFSQRRKELLSQRAIQGGEDYRYTVYTTWEVSRQMIKEISGEVGQDALELLQIFSFLHYEGISEEIFYRAWYALRNDRPSDWVLSRQIGLLFRQLGQEWDVYPLRSAVSVLLSFSLVHRDKNGVISIHPLVHAWVRDRLSRADEERIWTQATLITALSVPQTSHTADYRFRQVLVPHIDRCLDFQEGGIFYLEDIGEDCMIMAERFSLVYGAAGRPQKALQLMERVVKSYQRTLGEEHPNTLSSINNLAICYSKTCRRQEALQLIEPLLKVYKRTLGEEHPYTLSLIRGLAICYSETGRRQEALQLIEPLLKVYKRTLGEEHPYTLSLIRGLAICYSETGRRQEALQLIEPLLKANKKTRGEEHPETLRSRYNLAFYYNETGRRQEALQLIEQVIKIQKRTLGEEHPDTLRSIHNHACYYDETGRRQEALQLIERVIEARKRTLGDEHPDTLHSVQVLEYFQETHRDIETPNQHLSNPGTESHTQLSTTPQTKSHKRFPLPWKKPT